MGTQGENKKTHIIQIKYLSPKRNAVNALNYLPIKNLFSLQ